MTGVKDGGALETADEYATWLRRTGLAGSSKDAYETRVREFCAWIAERGAEYAEAFTDEDVRDYAARDYRRWLISERKLAPATVALRMSALSSLYGWLHMDPPRVPQTTIPDRDPKALSEDEIRRVLRAAQRRGIRDYAIAGLTFNTAARVGEIQGLDLDDVWLTDRKGQVSLLGKGDQPRVIDLNAQARDALRPWLADRPSWAVKAGHERALFLSREGKRIAVRSMQHLMGQLAEETGTDLSPHVLRHSFATIYLQGGGDVATLQRLLGHRHLSTTAGYTKPNRARLAAAVDSVSIEI